MEKTVHIVIYAKDRRRLQIRKKNNPLQPPVRDIIREWLDSEEGKK